VSLLAVTQFEYRLELAILTSVSWCPRQLGR